MLYFLAALAASAAILAALCLGQAIRRKELDRRMDAQRRMSGLYRRRLARLEAENHALNLSLALLEADRDRCRRALARAEALRQVLCGETRTPEAGGNAGGRL